MSELVEQLMAMVTHDQKTRPSPASLSTDRMEESKPCHPSLAEDPMGRQILRHLETLARTHQKKNGRLIKALGQFQERQQTMKTKLKQSERHANALQRELARVTRESDNYVTVMRTRVQLAERREKEASERQTSALAWKKNSRSPKSRCQAAWKRSRGRPR